MSVAYTMCFQIPFAFLSRQKTRPNRVLCVLKNASKSWFIARNKHSRDARDLYVKPFSEVCIVRQFELPRPL